MKKLLYLLLLLPLGFLASCHDDDDNINVNLEVALDNVGVQDNIVYAVADSAIVVQGVTCQGIGSSAIVTGATYYWDGITLFVPQIAPYGGELNPVLQTPGNHVLGVGTQIAQEGKALGFAAVNIRVKVVSEVDSLPAGVELGQNTIKFYGNTNE